MSRSLTASQVVSQGDYLESDFDPTSLTVSQLLGVLSFHSIEYKAPYSKGKLVQLFNEQIRPKASKFKKERIKKENSIASDEGITDGLTGQLINPGQVRRSSRRLSRAPSEDPEPSLPEPPKRRRSSAEPSLGRPVRSSKVSPNQPIVLEESEPEEDLPPVRKVGRSKKTAQAAGPQSRRVSQAEDSGWEDNNIFQSGAESSSPARPSPVRKPRLSRPRKSMSAPPQISPPASPVVPSHLRRDPLPQVKFEPDLPPAARLMSPRFSNAPHVVEKYEGMPTAFDFKHEEQLDEADELNLRAEEDAEEFEPQDMGEAESEYTEDDAKVIAIQRRLGGEVSVSPTRPKSSSSWIVRVVKFLLLLSVTAATVIYKSSSAPIGYCETGSNTNKELENLRSWRLAAEACNRENRTLLYPRGDDTPCPSPPLPVGLIPDSCTPCPKHAKCTQFGFTCDKGYMLSSPTPLFLLPPISSPSEITVSRNMSPSQAAWKAISFLTDGLPLVGSIGLRPSCVEDPKRKLHISILGKRIEATLGNERGRRLCSGQFSDKDIPAREGGEGKQWGLEMSELRQIMRPPKVQDYEKVQDYDDTFNDSVKQLLNWGGVTMTEDSKGTRYLARNEADLTWNCKLIITARDAWVEWRTYLTGLLGLLLFAYYVRVRRASGSVESQRVAGLVNVALDTLRKQELDHYTDPINTPQAYLPSLQLRDLIMQDEHRVSTRRRIWDQVERIVESNANVRVNLEEVQGGDELRVWRWVGGGRKSMIQQE
ncbi:Man1-Src1p-C-terminal domain-containing protein [Mycena floridula]|nr:Man1-Src1p-C-terminal domain-containing protein [Mycena floridula]